MLTIDKLYEIAPDSVKNLMNRVMPGRDLPGRLAEANAEMAAERGNYEPWDKLHPGEAERLSQAESRQFETLISKAEGRPIPNPTIDRDLDQPRLSLKL